MDSSRFFSAFTDAINWNAFVYIIYKMCFVSLTFILYSKLPSNYFSDWATANSFIFLLLLWLNCGFKKSIPRFAPLFSKNSLLHKKFVLSILAVQAVILALGLPILLYFLHRFTPHLLLVPLISILFITEGISSLLLLVYHAHFLQKRFNLIQAFFLLLEMIANFIFIFFFPSNPFLLVSFLFTSKLLANLGTIILSSWMLPSLYTSIITPTDEPLPTNTLVKEFIYHSLFMWIIGTTESLSERNFLFPFITQIQGLITANLFKVVNDAAIFFQRITIKTIGIADTTLLAYIVTTDNRLSQIKLACTTIFKTIFTLSIPLLFIGSLFFFKTHPHLTSTTIIFLIIATGTTFEMILSPYTRILEIKLCYRHIFLSQLPYLFGYSILIGLYMYKDIPLILFILITHMLRLTVVGIRVYYAKKMFQIHFLRPSFAFIILATSGFATLITSIFF